MEAEEADEQGWYRMETASMRLQLWLPSSNKSVSKRRQPRGWPRQIERQTSGRRGCRRPKRRWPSLRKLIRAKTNQLEAQLCNGVADDSPLAGSLRGEITEARERLQLAGVVLTAPPPPKKTHKGMRTCLDVIRNICGLFV